MNRPSVVNDPADCSDPKVTDPQATDPQSSPPQAANQPSYTKLAMRNMVRKGGKSLFHFALTTVGLLAVLIGLAYLTR